MNLASEAKVYSATNTLQATANSQLFPTIMRVLKNRESYASFALLSAQADCVTKNETDGEYYASNVVAQVPLTYVTYSQLSANTFKALYCLRLSENEYNGISFESICVCGKQAQDNNFATIPVYNHLVFYENDGSVRTFVKQAGEDLMIMIEIVLTLSVSGANFQLLSPWSDNLLIKWLLGTIEPNVNFVLGIGANEKQTLDASESISEKYFYLGTAAIFSNSSFVLDEETNTLTISYEIKSNLLYLGEYLLCMNKVSVGRFSTLLDTYDTYETEVYRMNKLDGKIVVTYSNFDNVLYIEDRNTHEVLDITPTFEKVPHYVWYGKQNDFFTYYKNFEKFYMSADRNLIAFMMQGKLDVFQVLEDDSLVQIDTSMVNIQNATEILLIDNHLFIFTTDEDVLRNYYNENNQFIPKKHSLQDALTDKLHTLSFSKVVVTRHTYENGLVMFRFGVLPTEANADGKRLGYVLEMAENENKDVWFQRTFVCDEIDNITKVVSIYPYETTPDCILFATAQDSTTNAYGLRLFYGEPLACVTPQKQIMASYLTRDDFINCGQLGKFFYCLYRSYKDFAVAFDVLTGNYYENYDFTNIYGEGSSLYSIKYNVISGLDPVNHTAYAQNCYSFYNTYPIFIGARQLIYKVPKLILHLNKSCIVIPAEGEELTSAYQGSYVYDFNVINNLQEYEDRSINVRIQCRVILGSSKEKLQGAFTLGFEGGGV